MDYKLSILLIDMLLSPNWQQGGGVSMNDILLSFTVSVKAGIVSYYICKWIDRQK